jgi:hypothetical protein
MTVDVTQIIIAAIGLVFTGILIPLVKAAFAWLKEKTNSEVLLTAISEAEAVADQVVALLQANVVNGLKAKSEDGKLSADDIKTVAEQAFDMFVSDISAKSLAVITNNADDIAAYVRNLIEARLLAMKK